MSTAKDSTAELQRMVDAIARQLETGQTWEEAEREPEDGAAGDEIMPAWYWLDDVLEIRRLYTQDGDFHGARILVTFGGPNIWIDTFRQCVEGYWWQDRAESFYRWDEMGLHGYLEAAGEDL